MNNYNQIFQRKSSFQKLTKNRRNSYSKYESISNEHNMTHQQIQKKFGIFNESETQKNLIKRNRRNTFDSGKSFYSSFIHISPSSKRINEIKGKYKNGRKRRNSYNSRLNVVHDIVDKCKVKVKSREESTENRQRRHSEPQGSLFIKTNTMNIKHRYNSLSPIRLNERKRRDPAQIIEENISFFEEINILKEELILRKNKTNFIVEKLKKRIDELKSTNEEQLKEIKKLKIKNEGKGNVHVDGESFGKLKREISFLDINENCENEGHVLLQYKHLKKEIEVIKTEKDEYRKYFKAMSKKNQKCRKIIRRLKSTIDRLKRINKWDEKGIQLKKNEGLKRIESDEMLNRRLKIPPRKLSNVLSDGNINIVIENSKKEMNFERVKRIRQELANLRNINYLLLTNVNEIIDENQVFRQKITNILPNIAHVSFLADRNKWEYSQIQMKIIEDLGLLDLYKNKNGMELSPAKEGYLVQKQKIGWKKVYISVLAKQNSISVYSTEKKQKLLRRESLHGYKIIKNSGRNVFEFRIKFANTKQIIFRCGKTSDKNLWIGFLDSVLQINSK